MRKNTNTFFRPRKILLGIWDALKRKNDMPDVYEGKGLKNSTRAGWSPKAPSYAWAKRRSSGGGGPKGVPAARIKPCRLSVGGTSQCSYMCFHAFVDFGGIYDCMLCIHLTSAGFIDFAHPQYGHAWHPAHAARGTAFVRAFFCRRRTVFLEGCAFASPFQGELRFRDGRFAVFCFDMHTQSFAPALALSRNRRILWSLKCVKSWSTSVCCRPILDARRKRVKV